MNATDRTVPGPSGRTGPRAVSDGREAQSASQPPVERIAPLSFEQEQTWSRQAVAQEPAIEHPCTPIAMRGPLDAGALRESLAAFIQRHEIWRTVFARVEGVITQAVLEDGDLAWSEADVGSLPQPEREGAVLHLAGGEVGRPFDLEQGPLVRALLVRLGDQEHRLLLTLHSMIFERSSLSEVFLPEVSELYLARVRGRPAALANGQPQYADYAISQRQRRARGAHETGLTFWREYLLGAPTVLEVPRDHRRPARRYLGTSEPFTLSPALTTDLRALSDQAQVALPTTLTASVAALLFRYTGEEDLLVGMAPSREGRRTAPPRAMGCPATTLALRTDLTGQPSVRELLARTQEAADAVRDHEDVPFGDLLAELQPEVGGGDHPLVQVRLAFDPLPPRLPLAWELEPTYLPGPTPQFVLSIDVEEQPAGLTGRFVYDDGRFEPGTVRRMIGHWERMLEGMVTEPDGPMSAAAPGAAERQRSAGGLECRPPLDAGPDIVESIADQARPETGRGGRRVRGTQLTYGQLNGRANQLARHLRELGRRARGAGGGVPRRSPDQ